MSGEDLDRLRDLLVRYANDYGTLMVREYGDASQQVAGQIAAVIHEVMWRRTHPRGYPPIPE